MGKEYITIGCKSSHNGTVTSGSDDTFYSNAGLARIGDTHSCPIHGTSSIVSTPQSTVYINNRLAAVDGAKAGCGATIYGCKGRTMLM